MLLPHIASSRTTYSSVSPILEVKYFEYGSHSVVDWIWKQSIVWVMFVVRTWDSDITRPLYIFKVHFIFLFITFFISPPRFLYYSPSSSLFSSWPLLCILFYCKIVQYVFLFYCKNWDYGNYDLLSPVLGFCYVFVFRVLW